MNYSRNIKKVSIGKRVLISWVTVAIIFSVAMGSMASANSLCSFAMGYFTTANGFNIAVGKNNKTPSATSHIENTGDIFIVGNGTVSSKSNAFRVAANGNVYGTKAYTASGADYAETFEWLDGNPDNEDRRGKFVTLDGEQIRLATADITELRFFENSFS